MTEPQDNNDFITKDWDKTLPVLRSVWVERGQQDLKWGRQDHHDYVWLAILAEEMGEVAKAVLEGEDELDIIEELVQVAAVAVAWVECIERNMESET